MFSFPIGTEFNLIRRETDADTEYLILEKERRYRIPSSFAIEIISEPISDTLLTWQLRYKIAADIAR